jgi:MFS family permease
MSTFRKSAPIIATAFVNKCGSIGLSLLAMVLVERNISSSNSSVLLGFVQSTGLFGLILGGWLADRIGFRAVMLFSLGMMALGFFGIPYSASFFALGLAAAIAQIGTVFYQSSVRMVLVDAVEPSERQEAMGWLKTGNNLGQVFSYSAGAVLWKAGTSFLMFLDGGTSLFALGVGMFYLPRGRAKQKSAIENRPNPARPTTQAQWRLFIFFTILLAGFSFMEELFMIGSSALFKVRFGSEGLHVFSVMMTVNTIICTLLAIPAAKIFKGAVSAFYFGLAFFALGSIMALSSAHSHALIYLGMLILTLGEISFTSMSQFVAIEMLPQAKSQGALYGMSLTLQMLGKICSGLLAFPLIVDGTHPASVMAMIALLLLGWMAFIHSSLSHELKAKNLLANTKSRTEFEEPSAAALNTQKLE